MEAILVLEADVKQKRIVEYLKLESGDMQLAHLVLGGVGGCMIECASCVYLTSQKSGQEVTQREKGTMKVR